MLVFVVVGVAITAALLVWLASAVEDDWQTFAATHNCRMVAQKPGSTGYIVGANGKTGYVFTPGTTGYLCDDGVTYWR
jgi:hypothetical protein